MGDALEYGCAHSGAAGEVLLAVAAAAQVRGAGYADWRRHRCHIMLCVCDAARSSGSASGTGVCERVRV